MRTFVIVCLVIFLTGCVDILKVGQTNQPLSESDQSWSEPFHHALEQLLQNDNPTAMNSFIKEHPESVFVNDAKQLLKLYSDAKACSDKLKSCSKQLDSSSQALKKLQEDIERLTQLNLEMDRSAP